MKERLLDTHGHRETLEQWRISSASLKQNCVSLQHHLWKHHCTVLHPVLVIDPRKLDHLGPLFSKNYQDLTIKPGVGSVCVSECSWLIKCRRSILHCPPFRNTRLCAAKSLLVLRSAAKKDEESWEFRCDRESLSWFKAGAEAKP